MIIPQDPTTEKFKMCLGMTVVEKQIKLKKLTKSGNHENKYRPNIVCLKQVLQLLRNGLEGKNFEF